MSQDPVNSTTFKLIRRNNAQSRRLGVMTKADLISEDDPTSHQQWLSMLNAASNNGLVRLPLQKLREQFRGYLLAMKPRVILSDASDYPDVIDLGSEDESQSDRSPPQPLSRNLSGGKKRPQELPFNTPSKKPRKNTGGITNYSYQPRG
ncbi:hypothetical protein Cpir12675_000930 [Ceratocystis pirilliformis]|uniref:PH domain-containing protein n=1 Tax=Ceratocystis pirilliformis TaxID=259994 RepID=A0ABR3ZIC4_9PEZI